MLYSSQLQYHCQYSNYVLINTVFKCYYSHITGAVPASAQLRKPSTTEELRILCFAQGFNLTHVDNSERKWESQIYALCHDVKFIIHHVIGVSLWFTIFIHHYWHVHPRNHRSYCLILPCSKLLFIDNRIITSHAWNGRRCQSTDQQTDRLTDRRTEFQSCRSNIINNISNTMTDRAIENHAKLWKWLHCCKHNIVN